MNFDSRSLERLKQLGRELPQPITTPQKECNLKNKIESKRHPIETEQDPSILFKELVKASKDGKIPKHLIDRLREVEKKKITRESINQNKGPIATESGSNSFKNSNISNTSVKDENYSLYIAFENLLLEEDI